MATNNLYLNNHLNELKHILERKYKIYDSQLYYQYGRDFFDNEYELFLFFNTQKDKEEVDALTVDSTGKRATKRDIKVKFRMGNSIEDIFKNILSEIDTEIQPYII